MIIHLPGISHDPEPPPGFPNFDEAAQERAILERTVLGAGMLPFVKHLTHSSVVQRADEIDRCGPLHLTQEIPQIPSDETYSKRLLLIRHQLGLGDNSIDHVNTSPDVDALVQEDPTLARLFSQVMESNQAQAFAELGEERTADIFEYVANESETISADRLKLFSCKAHEIKMAEEAVDVMLNPDKPVDPTMFPPDGSVQTHLKDKETLQEFHQQRQRQQEGDVLNPAIVGDEPKKGVPADPAHSADPEANVTPVPDNSPKHQGNSGDSGAAASVSAETKQDFLQFTRAVAIQNEEDVADGDIDPDDEEHHTLGEPKVRNNQDVDTARNLFRIVEENTVLTDLSTGKVERALAEHNVAEKVFLDLQEAHNHRADLVKQSNDILASCNRVKTLLESPDSPEKDHALRLISQESGNCIVDDVGKDSAHRALSASSVPVPRTSLAASELNQNKKIGSLSRRASIIGPIAENQDTVPDVTTIGETQQPNSSTNGSSGTRTNAPPRVGDDGSLPDSFLHDGDRDAGHGAMDEQPFNQSNSGRDHDSSSEILAHDDVDVRSNDGTQNDHKNVDFPIVEPDQIDRPDGQARTAARQDGDESIIELETNPKTVQCDSVDPQHPPSPALSNASFMVDEIEGDVPEVQFAGLSVQNVDAKNAYNAVPMLTPPKVQQFTGAFDAMDLASDAVISPPKARFSPAKSDLSSPPIFSSFAKQHDFASAKPAPGVSPDHGRNTNGSSPVDSRDWQIASSDESSDLAYFDFCPEVLSGLPCVKLMASDGNRRCIWKHPACIFPPQKKCLDDLLKDQDLGFTELSLKQVNQHLTDYHAMIEAENEQDAVLDSNVSQPGGQGPVSDSPDIPALAQQDPVKNPAADVVRQPDQSLKNDRIMETRGVGGLSPTSAAAQRQYNDKVSCPLICCQFICRLL